MWLVVNAVNILQSAGFVSRVQGPETQRILGLVILGLTVPATFALRRLAAARAGWRLIVGPALFGLFALFSLLVDHVLDVEFRQPRRVEILVPYLSLFFGSIFLMGAPMFRIDRRLWALTATTTVVLLGAMVYAIVHGVG